VGYIVILADFDCTTQQKMMIEWPKSVYTPSVVHHALNSHEELFHDAYFFFDLECLKHNNESSMIDMQYNMREKMM